MSWITPGRVACLGVILFVIGNELRISGLNDALEIIAGVLAAVALFLESQKPSSNG